MPLERKFSPVQNEVSDIPSYSTQWDWGSPVGEKGWVDLEPLFRVVILSDGGAGKTCEFESQAKAISENGRNSFFIRIEDIEDDLGSAFEIGCSDEFEEWLSSEDEAWFFLDSVDEARLESPRAFERAIKCFSKQIIAGIKRAHIFISARPYSWRFKSDLELVNKWLAFPKPKAYREDVSEVSETDDVKLDELHIFSLEPLKLKDVKQYSNYRGVKQIELFIQAIERANLIEMAARPFDLDGLIRKWNDDQCLGTRLELIQHHIENRLEENNPDRDFFNSLNLQEARQGARQLAAALVLTSQSSIQIPDNHYDRPGIQAAKILPEWSHKDLNALLSSALFDGVLYGAVRFRHREIRELLAAEWFSELLKKGNSRTQVESLIFRSQYGLEFIAPLIRPVMPWLILLDQSIRQRALRLRPEIAVEGGDVASLPLDDRISILKGVVHRIANGIDEGGAGHNEAILRIALPDLTETTKELVLEYYENDHAIFYLGRLASQGEMHDCRGSFLPIALDPNREVFARIAAIRAVMTNTEVEAAEAIWSKISAKELQLSRRLLAEVVKNTSFSESTLPLLIDSIGKLEAYSRNNVSGLTYAVEQFIDQSGDTCDESLLFTAIEGIGDYLKREPYVDRYECQISAEFVWLVPIAKKLISSLLKMRAPSSFEEPVISTLLTLITMPKEGLDGIELEEDPLSRSVSDWKEFNDKWFWHCASQVKKSQDNKDKKYPSYWLIEWKSRYWSYSHDDFDRVIKMVEDRGNLDEKGVALFLAFKLYESAGGLSEDLEKLYGVTKEHAELSERLNRWLNPVESEEEKRIKAEDSARKLERDTNEAKKKGVREKWISGLKSDPNRLREYTELDKGEWVNEHVWLLSELSRVEKRQCSSGFNGNWRALVDLFGDEVAMAFRDAAIKIWRNFKPELLSEGGDLSTRLYKQSFAMFGLECEFSDEKFDPSSLSQNEAIIALRYVPHELNNLPPWFQKLYLLYPVESLEFVMQELLYELSHHDGKSDSLYLLYKIYNHADWLHKDLIAPLTGWLSANVLSHPEYLRQVFSILINGGVSPQWVREYALEHLENEEIEIRPFLFALLVDADASEGISKLDSWLSNLSAEVAVEAAQSFINCLCGDRYEQGAKFHNYNTLRYLKELYLIILRFIRLEDDIERAGTGVYSPGPRDSAQYARDKLRGDLFDIPGKETYQALLDIAGSYKSKHLRQSAELSAYKRAELDSDVHKWAVSDIHDFANTLERTPATHKEMFDLAVLRLNDYKNWLEIGDDSQASLLQRVELEDEMRKPIAYWLNQHSHSRYHCSEEDPLANDQRPDIRFMNNQVSNPVPVELKLLDKGWSGSDLCERLRNQLVGDYLREDGSTCGVFLLVWQGREKESRNWMIDGKKVGVKDLQNALDCYWQGISSNYPGVEVIEVIVIDLTVRGMKSEH
ncbi:hypothetical protein NBRC116188_19700 [Oceaniserpentilla sp. 4NH20-0058]